MPGADVLAQIAEATAGTIVAAMASDVWSVARQRLRQILGREGGRAEEALVGELELARRELDSAETGEREAVLRRQRERWSETLLSLLLADPSAVESLRQFAVEFDPQGAAVRLFALVGGRDWQTENRPGAFSVAPPIGRLVPQVRGRAELIDALRGLIGRGGVGVQVLHGLGGCGKSTVALAVAAAAAQDGAQVWWVSGVDAATLSAGMREIAANLGAPLDLLQRAWSGRASATDLLWRLLAGQEHPWLLVIDNADEPEELSAPDVRLADGTGWIRPRTPGKGLVLVTSRDGSPSTWGSWAVLHQVDPLGEADATQVLLDLAGKPPGDRAEAAALARRLGGLPLALHFAGTYLAAAATAPAWPGARPVRTFVDYARALDHQATALLDQNPPGRHDPGADTPVSRTWELSLDLLARRGLPEARPLMRLLSAFGEAPVPHLRLLHPVLLSESPLFRGLDHQRLTAAMLGLADLGLIDFVALSGSVPEAYAQVLLLHPLVRDSNLEQPDVARWRAEYADLLSRLLTAATVELAVEDPAGWPLWRLMEPHCDRPLRLLGGGLPPPQGCLETVARALDYLLRVGNLDRAESMLDACADALDGLTPGALLIRSRAAQAAALRGRLEDAERLQQAVVDDTERCFGSPTREVAQQRYELALLLDQRGRTKEARHTFREVYFELSAALGAEHPQTLAARRGTALTARHLGRLAEAGAEYRQVLWICRNTLGDKHPETLATRHDLARVLHERGNFGAAERELRAVVADSREILGARNPATLTARHDLAEVLRDRGLLVEAERECREVLALCQAVHGDDHPETLAARYGLATVLRDRGWPSDAEFAFREVLDVRRRLLGDEHPQTLLVRHNLADILLQRGLLEEAEVEFRAVYRARRASLGEHHLLTLSVRHGAALVLRLRGLLVRAEAEYRSVLDDCVVDLGEQHPGTLSVRHGFADLCLEQGLLEEAEAEFRTVYRARRASLGEHHLLTLSVRHGAALVLRLRGLVVQAEAEYRSVLKDCVAVLGEQHPGTLAVREGLADLLLEQERTGDAEAEYRAVYESGLGSLGADHPVTRRMRARLQRSG